MWRHWREGERGRASKPTIGILLYCYNKNINNATTSYKNVQLCRPGIVKLGDGDYDGDFIQISAWSELLNFMDSTPSEMDVPALKHLGQSQNPANGHDIRDQHVLVPD